MLFICAQTEISSCRRLVNQEMKSMSAIPRAIPEKIQASCISMAVPPKKKPPEFFTLAARLTLEMIFL